VEKKFKQTGLIAFRRDFLLAFNQVPSTYLEKAESVDMLRILENGETVKMIYTSKPCPSVDTPADRSFVEGLMKDDQLFYTYQGKFK